MIDQSLLTLHSRSLTLFVRALTLISALSVLLLEGRMWFTGTHHLLFLPWNLGLAWIPFGLALVAETNLSRDPQQRWKGWLSLAGWLFFFPNAPYILTDVVWYFRGFDWFLGPFDLVLLGLNAFIGLLLGLGSLLIVHRAVTARAGAAIGWVFIALSDLLAGFGIYVGRFMRWNSWDVVTNPLDLVAAVIERLSHPEDDPRLLGVTLDFAVLLVLLYLLLVVWLRRQSRQEAT